MSKPKREYYQDMVRHATVRYVDRIQQTMETLKTQQEKCSCSEKSES